MNSVQPYLVFNGNCEEAVNFYCKIFKGEIQFTTRFTDLPGDVPLHWREKIMHCNFIIRGDQLMASDSMPNQVPIKGNNVNLCVNFGLHENVDEYWAQLKDGGSVTMELHDTFWGARFGMLIDRYGISWMFSQHKEEN